MTGGLIIPLLVFSSLQPGKLTEAFKYFIQGMGYSKYSRHAMSICHLGEGKSSTTIDCHMQGSTLPESFLPPCGGMTIFFLKVPSHLLLPPCSYISIPFNNNNNNNDCDNSLHLKSLFQVIFYSYGLNLYIYVI